jgi:alpha-tubulin suppressor-like RCC1 family protein
MKRRPLLAWFSIWVLMALVAMYAPATAAGAGPPTTGTATGVMPGMTQVRSVAATGNDFVALRADGTVWSARMAINEQGIPSKPRKHNMQGRMMAVTAGGAYAFALSTDGTVWQSALDAPDQAATQVPDLTGIKAISAGPDYLAVLGADGRVSYLAINTGGTSVKRTTAPGTYRWIAAGAGYLLAGMGDGSVRSMAVSQNGDATPIIRGSLMGATSASLPQSGPDDDCDGVGLATGAIPGGAILSFMTPPPGGDLDGDGVPDLTEVTRVSAGCHGGLALKADGTVWQVTFAIGEPGVHRAVGAGQVTEILGAIAIAAGRDFNAAVLGDGSVRVWQVPLTARRFPDLANVKRLIAGAGHGAALLADGTVAELAISEAGVHKAAPMPGLGGIVDAAVAGNFLLALKADGTVQQARFGTQRPPVAVDGLSGVTALAGAGSSFALALRKDGTLALIAIDEQGVHLTAAAIPIKDVVAVSAGPDSFLAITADGKGWGGSVKGNTVAVAAAADVITAREAGSGMATGRRQHIALMGDGSVRVITLDEQGQARTLVWGDPHVDQAGGFAGVSAGTDQLALVKGDGSLWVAPIAIDESGVHVADAAGRISGPGAAVAVAETDAYGYALDGDGTVWYWPGR